ncbi:MAG: chorismate mutase [Candidatus Aureabacteria bacterium]|nr:chorismate mutase [Candidatus Auribacterota bacterium]
MAIRGIRGAIQVDNNTSEEIISDSKHLLEKMIEKNNINKEEVASIVFTVTTDLTADFPAIAARKLGFSHTPLICMTEIPVPNSLKMVVRILIHYNTDTSQKDMIHVYLKDAVNLRPDLNCK